MSADCVLAAHSALAEMSAHPVSKSSSNKRLHHPTLIQKTSYWPERGTTIRPRSVTHYPSRVIRDGAGPAAIPAMSVMPPEAEVNSED